MMFKTHVVFTFLIAFLISNLIPYDKVIFIAVALLFTAIPDIDTDKSKIGKKFPSISRPLSIIFGHHGFIHTIYIPMALFIIFYLINLKYIGLAILIGYLTHLLLDSFIKSGVKPFIPLSKLTLKGFVKTGGLFDYIFFILLLIVDIFLIFSRN